MASIMSMTAVFPQPSHLRYSLPLFCQPPPSRVIFPPQVQRKYGVNRAMTGFSPWDCFLAFFSAVFSCAAWKISASTSMGYPSLPV